MTQSWRNPLQDYGYAGFASYDCSASYDAGFAYECP